MTPLRVNPGGLSWKVKLSIAATPLKVERVLVRRGGVEKSARLVYTTKPALAGDAPYREARLRRAVRLP